MCAWVVQRALPVPVESTMIKALLFMIAFMAAFLALTWSFITFVPWAEASGMYQLLAFSAIAVACAVGAAILKPRTRSGFALCVVVVCIAMFGAFNAISSLGWLA